MKPIVALLIGIVMGSLATIIITHRHQLHTHAVGSGAIVVVRMNQLTGQTLHALVLPDKPTNWQPINKVWQPPSADEFLNAK